MKSRALFTSIFVVSLALQTFCQPNVSGTLVYNSGEILNFHDIISFVGKYSDGFSINGPGDREIVLNYNSTKRSVPLKKIKYIKVLRYRSKGNILKDVLLDIKMKNGKRFEMSLEMLGSLYKTRFLDDLTGEITEQHYIFFGKNSKLNIREVHIN